MRVLANSILRHRTILLSSGVSQALQKLGHIDASLTLTVCQFNAAFARSSLFGSVTSRCDGLNQSGIFRVSFQHCHYYYLTQETEQVMYPSPLDRAWKERMHQIAASELLIPSTSARPAAMSMISTTDTTAENIGDATNGAPAGGTVEEEEGSSPFKRQKQTDSRRTSTTSYWPYSPEAHHLFRPRRGGGTSVAGVTVCNESPQEAAKRCIRVCNRWTKVKKLAKRSN